MSVAASISDTAPSTYRHVEDVLDGIIVLAIVFVLWIGVHAFVGDAALASPKATLAFLGDFLRTPVFWSHFAATAVSFATALLISALLGILFGFVLGLNRFAGDVAEPLLAGFYSIPKVTLYPMILLIFGLGMSAKVAFGVIHGVVPVILFTMGAVKNLSPVLLRTARAMRLSQIETVKTIVVPAILPEMLSGLGIGFSLTLFGVLIGEMFASQRGLGFLLVNSTSLNNVPMTTGMIVIVIAFAFLANGLLRWLTVRLTRNRRGARGEARAV